MKKPSIILEIDHYKQLYENSPLLTVFYDKEGNVFKVNKSWQDFFQITTEEVVGVYNINNDPLVHKWGLLKYWKAAQEGDCIDTHDFDYDPKEFGFSGKKLWLKGRFGSIKDENNEILFFYIQMQEISERKKLEEKIINIQKWETIQTFSGGIAHDLNNILTAFSASISYLKEEYLQKILQICPNFEGLFSIFELGVNDAIQLANQMLVFSKGNIPLKKPTDLYQVVKDSIKFISHGKKVEFKICSPEKIWPIYADPTQISQVIQNIALNSIQAMKDFGKIIITLNNVIINPSNQYGLNEGEYISINIRDTGPGIPPDILPKIFDIYFSTKKTGNGLGLSVSKSIIELHNGYFEFIKNLSSGAQAHILLPANSIMIVSEDHIPLKTINLIGKVLILDDEKIIRRLLKILCKNLNIDAVICSNSEQALKEYSKAMEKREIFDVVLTDLTLRNENDGSSFFKKILSLNKNANGIVMSGYTNSDVLANFAEYGFKNRLKKPFTLTDLKTILAPFMKDNKS